MKFTNFILLATIALTITACCTTKGRTNNQVFPADNIPEDNYRHVSDVIDSVKCGMAIFIKEQQKLVDNSQSSKVFIIEKAEIDLDLTNVVQRTGGENAGLTIPVAGVSIGPSASSTDVGTSTGIAKLKLDMKNLFDPSKGEYKPVTEDSLKKFCKLNPDKTGALMNITTHPISTLLNGYRVELEQVTSGFPTVQSNTLETSAQFQLQNTRTAGIEIEFLVVEIGAETQQQATNTQLLKIKYSLAEYSKPTFTLTPL